MESTMTPMMFWQWVIEELNKRYEMEDGRPLSYSAAAKLLDIQANHFNALLRGRANAKPSLYVIVKFKELCPGLSWDEIMTKMVEAFGGRAEAFKPAARGAVAVRRRESHA